MSRKSSSPKIWLIINSQKKGPFAVLEVSMELSHGNLHLIDQGSYDGLKWLALGEMPEFKSFKMDLPLRPDIKGDPTRIVRIADLIAQDQASPEKKLERSLKRQNRILQGVCFATVCCILALNLKFSSLPNRQTITQQEVKLVLQSNEQKDSPLIIPNKVVSKETIQSVTQLEQVSPQEEYQEDVEAERELNAAAKQAYFTRLPASDEMENNDEESDQSPTAD